MILRKDVTSSRMFRSLLVLALCFSGTQILGDGGNRIAFFAVVLVHATTNIPSRSTLTTAATFARRPDFVSHVDSDFLHHAFAISKRLHAAAVQKALENYPVDSIPEEEQQAQQEELGKFASIDHVQLQRHAIDAPGSLPDFGSEIPRAVYVTDPPLLSKQECCDVIAAAETHFANTNNGCWSIQQSGQYNVAGFWIKNVPAVNEWFLRTVRQRLFPLLVRTFPDFCQDPNQLCVDNAYLFKYNTETGRRTDIHTDSGCLSFTIAMNHDPPTEPEYTGGGTWFEGLKQSTGCDNDGSPCINPSVVEMNIGQVTIRPGGIKHCGKAVTSGVRYIIGGFCMHRHKVEHVRQWLVTATDDSGCDDDERRMALEAAVAVNPTCDVPYNLLAHHYEQVRGDPDRAQQVLEYCLEHVHPGSGDVAYALGSLYLSKATSPYSTDPMKRQQLLEDAKRCFEVCLRADQDGDVDAIMSLAQVCSLLQDKATEKALYERIVNMPYAGAVSNETLAAAFTNLGVLQPEGSNDEVACYQAALRYSPERFAPWYSLGNAHGSRKEWPEAVHALQQAVHVALSSSSSDPSKQHQQIKSALQGLYKMAVHQLQAEQVAKNANQDSQAMLQRLQSIMGAENYQRLASLSQR